MGPCDWGTTPDQREFSRNRFWTRTSSTKFSAYAGVLRLTADNDERHRTAVQRTAFLRKDGDHALYHHQASFGHAALRYEQAVRNQAQAAIERATALHQSEMTHELHRLENIVEQKGSEHHLHTNGQSCRKFDERTKSKPDRGWRLHRHSISVMKVHSSGGRLKSCFKQLHFQSTSLRHQTVAELQTQHQQTLQVRSELTRMTEEVNSCCLMKEKIAAELQQQYDRAVQERDHVASRLGSSTLDPMTESVEDDFLRYTSECQRLDLEMAKVQSEKIGIEAELSNAHWVVSDLTDQKEDYQQRLNAGVQNEPSTATPLAKRAVGTLQLSRVATLLRDSCR